MLDLSFQASFNSTDSNLNLLRDEYWELNALWLLSSPEMSQQSSTCSISIFTYQVGKDVDPRVEKLKFHISHYLHSNHIAFLTKLKHFQLQTQFFTSQLKRNSSKKPFSKDTPNICAIHKGKLYDAFLFDILKLKLKHISNP